MAVSLSSRVGRDETRVQLPRLYEPDGADHWIAAVGCDQWALNDVFHSKCGGITRSESVVLGVLQQGDPKRLSIFQTKAKSMKEARFGTTKRMLDGEKVVGDLQLVDDRVFDVR